MSSKPYPTTLAELDLCDTSTSTSLYRSIRDIRRSTLSLANRLTSILHDAQFVRRVARRCCLPVVANERCGSWYIEPSSKAGSVYFKSTDGHHGQWTFSLRRLNLQLLSVLGQHGGAIVVDSTRRGKNMPDSFLKTVPIWVVVMNRTLFPERTDMHALQCPPAPDDLGRSEILQIEARLNDFVTSFRDLNLDLRSLTTTLNKPIAIHWVVNGRDSVLDWRVKPSEDQDCNCLILCSASRRVEGAEASEAGYIQGAGDDSESWAYGLTPNLFWKHQELLLYETPEEELSAVVARLLSENSMLPSSGTTPRLINPTSTLYIGAASAQSSERFNVMIDCTASTGSSSKNLLGLGCREGKLGSRELRDKLAAVKDFTAAVLAKEGPGEILVTCRSCRDLSAGIALMLLCLFYNEVGGEEINPDSQIVNKALIKKRMAWISSSMPDVNPSRATLQSVNAFLMRRP